MGRRISELIRSAPDMELAAGVDLGDSLDEALGDADVAVDFTIASACAENAGRCARLGVPIVIGTTGLGGTEEEAIRSAAKSVPVVYSPNMSIGVNVLFDLLRTAARTLGRDFAVDIEEVHHARKVDRPSGTAKRAADILSEEIGEGRVRVESVRTGNVVGDHTVAFRGESEDLILTHHAKDRGIFAQGAVKAARWIAGRPAGLYDMSDVLGLKGSAAQ
jgi:4-hydroxy-tetrahydrodipicolinate reductase